MSKLALSLIGFGIAALALAAIFWLTRPISPGKLIVQKGQATVIRDGQQIPVKDQVELEAFDSVSIPTDGLATLNLSDGSLIRIAPETQLVIKQITYVDQLLKRAQFQLLEGQVWGKVKSLEAGAAFEVETPTIVAAVRGTRFSVNYRQAVSRVFVAEDQVAVARLSHPTDFKTVQANQFFVLNDATIEADFEAGPQPADSSIFTNDWIKFNQLEDGLTDWPPAPVVSSPTPEATTAKPKVKPKVTPSTSPAVKGVQTNSTETSSVTPTPIETPPTPAPEPVLTELKVSYVVVSPNDRTAQFMATAIYDDGSTQDVTLTTNWSVDEKGAGSITSTGSYSAGRQASDTIFATYGMQTTFSYIDL